MELGSKEAGAEAGLWPDLGLGLEWQLKLMTGSSYSRCMGDRAGEGQGMGRRTHKGSSRKSNRNVKGHQHLILEFPDLMCLRRRREHGRETDSCWCCSGTPLGQRGFFSGESSRGGAGVGRGPWGTGGWGQVGEQLPRSCGRMGQEGPVVRFAINSDVLISKTISEHRFGLDIAYTGSTEDTAGGHRIGVFQQQTGGVHDVLTTLLQLSLSCFLHCTESRQRMCTGTSHFYLFIFLLHEQWFVFMDNKWTWGKEKLVW